MEIFIIYRFFYTSEELAHFFYPVLYKDLSFDTLVRTNFNQAKQYRSWQICVVIVYPNSKEYLSGISNFTLPVDAATKISKIKASLLDKTIPIKSIAYELGFVDQSHLNAFCKKYLNATPLQIRNSSEVKNNQKIEVTFNI